jgi:hypothetical protein
MPRARSVADIKSNLLQPALTSHYEVTIPMPGQDDGKFTKYLKQNARGWNPIKLDKINLACCEALLPGSNLATLELNGDHTGVTERHVHRRVYDDRIDLSFYVDGGADAYLQIYFFETWMKYITNESRSASPGTNPGIDDPAFFYQVKYLEEYAAQQGFSVTKFERNIGAQLVYKFVNVFPISITSMPVSYEASSLLKITVSFSYIRYYIENMPGEDSSSSSLQQVLTPAQQAAFNNFDNPLSGNGFSDKNFDARAQAALGGISFGSADPAVERAYQALYNPEPLF